MRFCFLELGKDANIEDVTFNTAREGPAYKRIRILQYTTMFKLYSETMHDYNENLLRYHDKCSSLLHQQRRLRKAIQFEFHKRSIKKKTTYYLL